MTRIRCGSLVALGLVLVGAGTASAQSPGPVKVPTAGGEVTVLADHLEQIGPDNLLVATGNVEISRGTARLTADRVELNRESGDAVAQGHVIFYDGDDRLAGSRIEYNVKTGTGVVYEGAARAAPYYRISGDRLERLGESVYRVHRGVFTTCEDDSPDWSFHFGSATADLNDFVYGSNASFWVKHVPVIPWFPWFAAAIRRERQTGFLFPELGSSSRKGFFAKLPFFWAISDSQDATVSLDVFERRGVGASGEYRYVLSESQRGTLGGFYIRETARGDEDRGFGSFKHDWQIAPGFSLRADVNGVSDDFVLGEYGDRLRERSAQRAESNVFLTRTWPNWNFVANLFWYQDLTTRRPFELQRVPDLRLEGVRQPLPGLPGFLYRVSAGATHFVRDVGSDGTRFDLHPVVSRPIPAGGYVTVTPFVGGRLTVYDKTVTGFRDTSDGRPEGTRVVVETTKDEARVRRLAEVGSDVESRATRVYRLGGWGGIDSAIHSIEPRLNYTWITGENTGQLPFWTEVVDRIPKSSTVSYSITNRIRAKTLGGEGTEPVRWELVRFLVGHSYNLTTERPGNVIGDLIVEPSGVLRFRGDAAYNVDGDRRRGIPQGLQTANTDLSAKVGRVTGSVGTRFIETARVNFLQGGVTAEVTRNLAARFNTNWDLRRDTFVENRFGLDFRFQCWGLSLEYVDRARTSTLNTGEDEFRFALNLLGVGTPIRSTVGVGGAGVAPRLK